MFRFFDRKSYSPREKVMFRFLRRSDLFHDLTDDELATFIPHLHPRRYLQNEAIFFRGDPSQALYIIKSGEVKLNLDVEDSFEELITLTRGDTFGDNAILEGARRNFNAIAASEVCELWVLAQVNILEIFEEEPQIKAKMALAFAAYYDRYVRHIVKAYRNNFGFFNLGEAYLSAKREKNKN
ncbi:MAG: cyclic nucleotide-binding domain-containing protein [Cytophagales bacterium]|nr:cyclic nucleotide-binding domain-containing protein [Bernardetiaceae bacterium]MDW8205651.1 cyclic nucleotide-binding domain-containing protein [Cytophagales bacterium]